MTIYRWSTTPSGAIIDPFNPNTDQLLVDLPFAAAADLLVAPSGSLTTFSYGGGTVSLRLDVRAVTPANVTFSDGSRLLVGDTTTSVVADDSGNTIVGTANNDQILGLGGADHIWGLAGNDNLAG